MLFSDSNYDALKNLSEEIIDLVNVHASTQ